jgi:hypothetical protein
MEEVQDIEGYRIFSKDSVLPSPRSGEQSGGLNYWRRNSSLEKLEKWKYQSWSCSECIEFMFAGVDFPPETKKELLRK